MVADKAPQALRTPSFNFHFVRLTRCREQVVMC
jgi:hypothetical protein